MEITTKMMTTKMMTILMTTLMTMTICAAGEQQRRIAPAKADFWSQSTPRCLRVIQVIVILMFIIVVIIITLMFIIIVILAIFIAFFDSMCQCQHRLPPPHPCLEFHQIFKIISYLIGQSIKY